MHYQRYAIYYTAPAGPLADFGAAWLGWDIATGETVEHPSIPRLDDDIATITQKPRKYGFHGTIKPPFRLAEDTSANQLMHETETLCASLPPLTLGGLELTRIGSFLALTLTGDAAPLVQLAGTVVKSLDHFRAPASDEELAKRRKANLTEQQDQNLMAWGYPYVMDDFRFHLTLSGRLKAKCADALHAALKPVIAEVLPNRFRVDDLTLVGEDTQGRFHEIRRFSLGINQ